MEGGERAGRIEENDKQGEEGAAEIGGRNG